MLEWLPWRSSTDDRDAERFDWPEDDVMEFLSDHGNPGKGQALALISTKERRDGRYRQAGGDHDA